MFESRRIIALDVGASKLVLAEFFIDPAGTAELLNYGIAPLGVEAQEGADSSAYIVAGIRDLMRERGMKPAPLLMSISGQSVFPRFVKLPAVTREKLVQIVQYEAEQNVPFPIEEVVWDYQLIGGEAGEMNVMLVAVKIENVKYLTDCVVAAGMEPAIVDVSPMALYNTVRYNYPALEGCTMVLDIGARSSNLIFLEGARIFSRSIPVAGNAITQELAKEFDVPFADADDMKQEQGFVAFGGVYAGPDSEIADRISKIVRNVVTRLHAEVNRSINFYRSQQGGSFPSLVLLTGGSSAIPHADTFFREKLKVEVEYLNPFVHVAVSEAIDVEQVGNDMHVLGEVVGLALRRALTCPVEINLMPPDLLAKKVFRRRQPFFGLIAVGVALIMLCWWVYAHRMKAMQTRQRRVVQEAIAKFRTDQTNLAEVSRRKKAAAKRAETVLGIVSRRTQWLQVMNAIHGCMLEGMWLTELKPVVDDEGGISVIDISGAGFEDNLRQEDKGGTTAIEVFRDKLQASDYFMGRTEITWLPPHAGKSTRSFSIRIYLETTIASR
jgi:type IV pilus assembly protein PilM